jgi:hypothetical protein
VNVPWFMSWDSQPQIGDLPSFAVAQAHTHLEPPLVVHFYAGDFTEVRVFWTGAYNPETVGTLRNDSFLTEHEQRVHGNQFVP